MTLTLVERQSASADYKVVEGSTVKCMLYYFNLECVPQTIENIELKLDFTKFYCKSNRNCNICQKKSISFHNV